MATVKINLSRALKLKNRLASRLSRLDSIIVQHNSAVRDNSEFNVRELYKRRMLLAEQLVQLKVDISQANSKIQKQIYEVAECKAVCAMLTNIETKHGPQSVGYGEQIQDFQAQFREADVKNETRKVEREIDRLQEELDQFNFQTQIEVPDGILADGDDF